MLAFCCLHVAAGEAVWKLERNEPSETIPESLDAVCWQCKDLPQEAFTVDDVVVLDAGHLRSRLIELAG